MRRWHPARGVERVHHSEARITATAQRDSTLVLESARPLYAREISVTLSVWSRHDASSLLGERWSGPPVFADISGLPAVARSGELILFSPQLARVDMAIEPSALAVLAERIVVGNYDGGVEFFAW